MAEMSADARHTLEAFYAIHTRGGGERQSHTERAIENQAELASPRVSAAIQELTKAGYITTSMSPWEGEASLTSFRLSDKGRRVVDPAGSEAAARD